MPSHTHTHTLIPSLSHKHTDLCCPLHTQTHAQTHPHTLSHTLTHTHLYSLTHALTHTYIYTLPHTCTHTRTHTHAHTPSYPLSLTHTHIYTLTHAITHTHALSNTHSESVTPKAHLTLQLHKRAAHPPCPALTTLFRLPGMLSPVATPSTPLCLVLQLSAPAQSSCPTPTSTSLPELLPHTVLPSGCGEARLGTAGPP